MNLDASEAFYSKFLGLRTTFKTAGRSVFMAADPNSSHELALFYSSTQRGDVGLVGIGHVAWRVASFKDLQVVYRQLIDEGISIESIGEHGISLGIYFRDPDGYLVEVYHELPPEEWPAALAMGSHGYPYTLDDLL
jgi:catechol 2,3-dioxygenase